ncbi:hypothetical protein Plhal304r1_c002g0008031 [Plasmopara halstedii]
MGPRITRMSGTIIDAAFAHTRVLLGSENILPIVFCMVVVHHLWFVRVDCTRPYFDRSHGTKVVLCFQCGTYNILERDGMNAEISVRVALPPLRLWPLPPWEMRLPPSRQ